MSLAARLDNQDLIDGPLHAHRPGHSYEWSHAVMQASPHAIIAFDRRGNVTLWNPAAERLLGWKAREVLGRPLECFPTGFHNACFIDVERSIDLKLLSEVETRGNHRDGTPVDLSVSRVGVYDGDGRLSHVVAFLTDVTELRRTARALRESEEQRRALAESCEVLRCQAIEDELTGLYNRRGFMIVAEHHLKLATRMGTRMSLLLADMDDLKAINDRLGHQKGDEAIATVGRILKKNCRESDVVSRFGGDEFAILMLDALPDNAAVLVQRIQNALSAVNADEWYSHPLSLSIGLAHVETGSCAPINELLVKADRLMYEEKRATRRLCGDGGKVHLRSSLRSKAKALQ